MAISPHAAVSALVFAAAIGPCCLGQLPYRVVAFSQSQAPGTGTTFYGFNYVFVNEAGRVGIHGSYPANHGAFWAETSHGLVMLAREEMTVPSAGPSATLGNLYGSLPITFTDAGNAVFFANLMNSPFSGGIFQSTPAGLVDIALNNRLAPSRSIPLTYTGFSSAASHPSGSVAFAAYAQNGSSAFAGLWARRPGENLRLVMVNGEHAPGTPEGVNFEPTTVPSQYCVNSAGDVAFVGTLAGTPTRKGVWYEHLGEVQPLAQYGDLVPGMAADVTYLNFYTVAMNDLGMIAFQAQIASPTTSASFGVFTTRTGSMELVARSGQPAAGIPGQLFQAFGSMTFSDRGEVTFICPFQAIFSNLGGTLRPLVRTAAAAPGTEAGTTFRLQYSDAIKGADDAGSTIFIDDLQGPLVTNLNRRGAWAIDRTGNIQLVVRTGQQIDVNPSPSAADLRTISTIGRTAVSARGHVAMAVTFTDATSAVLAFRLPGHCSADLGQSGGLPGEDGVLDNNDFVAFISLFFSGSQTADIGTAGGQPGADDRLDNNDWIAFINQFFAGCTP